MPFTLPSLFHISWIAEVLDVTAPAAQVCATARTISTANKAGIRCQFDVLAGVSSLNYVRCQTAAKNPSV